MRLAKNIAYYQDDEDHHKFCSQIC